MFEGRRPAAINVTNLRKMDASPVTGNIEHSPGLTVRRRRTKIEKTMAKTSEQLIQESHEMLMQYIDGLDNQVKKVLDNHEAQFLVAYRKHSQKVKEQMKQIKHQMLENAQNQKAYLDRIRYLDKQLVVFREETLKMSEKLISKNEQIEDLKIKLKEAMIQCKHQKDSIVDLTKIRMGLTAQLQKQQKINNHVFNLQIEGKKTNKFAQLTQIDVKQHQIAHHQASPLSQLKSHTAQLRTRSIRNRQKLTLSKLISSTIQQNPHQFTPQQSLKDQSCDDKSNTIKTDLSNNRKKSSSFKARFEKSRFMETEIEKLKSKSFAQRNEYQRIFIDCVEEVRKNIMRKDFADSLNYFKQNGPKNYIQFKKLDYFVLLELFLRKESISKKMYDLIFESQSP